MISDLVVTPGFLAGSGLTGVPSRVARGSGFATAAKYIFSRGARRNIYSRGVRESPRSLELRLTEFREVREGVSSRLVRSEVWHSL